MFQRFEELLIKIEKVIITLMLALMFVAVVVQVFVRYFNLPIRDTTEMSVMTMALITFMGCGLLVHTKDHITCEIDQLFRSHRVRFLFELFTSLAMLIFIGVFTYLGYDLLMYAVEGGEKTLELGIPLTIPFATMVIGMILMLIHTVSNIIKLFTKSRKTAIKIDIES